MAKSHIHSATGSGPALGMIPNNNTGMFLLDIGIGLFFRCHGTDNDRFFNR